MASKAKKKDDTVVHDEFFTKDGSKATLITKEGLAKLKEELDQLKKVKRKEVAARIKEAISFGDLSENSEYEEAKNEQAFVEGRILELEVMIKKAKVVDQKHHSKKVVEIGTKVKIKNTKRKTEEFEFIIVGSTESDPFSGRVSNESPVGESLMGAKQGEKVMVNAPGGRAEFEVVKLS